MKAAGLTHGGHFSSKDDLIAQTLVHVLAADSGGGGDLRAFVDAYLSPRQRDKATGGCPTAGLAAAIRQFGSSGFPSPPMITLVTDMGFTFGEN